MTKKLTTHEVVKRSIVKHGTRYGYGLVNFINCKTKITVICHEHGNFDILPRDHFSKGAGCGKCAGYGKTNEEHIGQFNLVHSVGRFDYSKSIYVKAREHITVICHRHSEPYEFLITPDNHKRGKGCPKCVGKHFSRDETIENLNVTHNNKYEYTYTIFSDNKSIILIKCPLHGYFTQSLAAHKRGHGCPLCANSKNANKQTHTQEHVLSEFYKVHGDKFDYSKFIYNGNLVNSIIICRVEGHGEFSQTPATHKGGSGCPRCIGRLRTPDDVIKLFHNIHGNKLYDYSLMVFRRMGDHIQIICNRCNGTFPQTPEKHISGNGCPVCNSSGGFQSSNSGKLYVLSVDTPTGYNVLKIGITNKTVEDRYKNRDLDIITVAKVYTFSNGSHARTIETNVKRLFKQFKWSGNDLLSSGNSELFIDFDERFKTVIPFIESEIIRLQIESDNSLIGY